MPGHKTSTTTEQEPSKERSDKRVTDTNPSSGHTELPTELTCVTDKDYRRKVGSSVRKRRKPRSNFSTSQNKPVYRICRFSTHYSHRDHYSKKHDEKYDFYYHKAKTPSASL
jgi:hypothetical protein